MKVLHLRDPAGQGAPVSLHPQITVVRGLDPVRRAWLLDVLGRLAGGRSLPAAGELEAHGIRFDLDDDSLALLGLEDPVATVVTAGDLPGHDHSLVEATRAQLEATRVRDELVAQLEARRSAVAAAIAERDRAATVLDELQRGEGAAREAIAASAAERSRLEAELQQARAVCEQREQAVAEAVRAAEAVAERHQHAQERLAAAQARRRSAIEAAMQAAAAVEEARSGSETLVDPAQVVDSARNRLVAAEDAAAAADPDHDDSPVNRRLADLERRRVELARLEVAMGQGGSEAVAKALDDLASAASESPPVVAALALADTWRDLHQQIAALEAGVSPDERAAEDLVATARQGVAEAESDFNQPVLTPEQIAKVEASHTAVLEAQERAEGRFAGTRARRRLDELRADERRVLERLGFSTYADYMMSSSSRGVAPANRAIVELARTNLDDAEGRLTTLPGAGDRARRRSELLQRRDAVAPRVADLLGHEPTGPEAEEELRNLREPTAPDEGLLNQLADQLTMAGIMVGQAPYDRDELELLAKAYLAEERAAEAQRTDVAKAVAALDTAIDDLRAARSRGVVDLPIMDPLPELAEPSGGGDEVGDEAAALTLREARWAEVEAARATLAEAEAEWARVQEATQRLAGLEAVLAERSDDEAVAAREVAEAEAEANADIDTEMAAATQAIEDARAALAAAQAAAAQVADAIEAHQSSSGVDSLVASAVQAVTAAESALAEATAGEHATTARLVQAEAARDSAAAAEVDAHARALATAGDLDRAALVDDVEWALLARLATVRSVGPGGSVPLVLDHPFPALRDHEVAQVLDRLAQMAGAVQVVVVSDHQAVADWAARLGPDRVGVHSGS